MEDPVSPSDLTGLESVDESILRCSSVVDHFPGPMEDNQRPVGSPSVHTRDNSKQLASESLSVHRLGSEQSAGLGRYIQLNQQLAAKSTSEVSLEVLTGSTAAGGDGRAREGKGLRGSPARMPVHERLYQLRRKPTPEVRASYTPSPSPKPADPHYCNWLYMRGMQSKEELKVRTERVKEQRELQIAKETTFVPAINRISSLMTPRIELSTEESLYRKAGEKAQRMAIKRSLSEELRLKACPFTPKTNHKRTSTRSTQPRFALLYEEACKRTERKQKSAVTPQFPFKPKLFAAMSIPKPDPKSLGIALKPKGKPDDVTVKRGSLTDRGTVPPAKATHTERRSLAGQSIHDYLYSLKARPQHPETPRCKPVCQTPKPSSKSQDYIRALKQRAFKRYFDLIDTDSDGRISPSKCSLSTLDKRVAALLSPVVKQAGSAGITLAEFSERTEELLKRLSPGEKSMLMRGEGEVKEPERRVTTMQPFSSLGFVLRPPTRLSDASDIYTRSQGEKEVTVIQRIQAKLRAQHESREKELSQTCTFRPFTVKGKHRSTKNLH